MTRLVVLAGALLVLGGCDRIERTQPETPVLPVSEHVKVAPVKIVTWNLEWFPGGTPNASAEEQKSRMIAAQAAVKKISPTVLCLQEVRDWSAVAELISVLPDFQVSVVSGFSGKQQQAIATMLRVDSAWSDKWRSVRTNDPPRGYAFAAITRGAVTYLIYSLHLKANGRDALERDIAKREESSRQLREHVVEMEKLYGKRGKTAVVLCGDWNTTLDPEPRFDQEQTLRGFLQIGFYWTGVGVPFAQRISHPGGGGYPAIQFDHVITKGLPEAKCRALEFPGVSDHMPILVELP